MLAEDGAIGHGNRRGVGPVPIAMGGSPPDGAHADGAHGQLAPVLCAALIAATALLAGCKQPPDPRYDPKPSQAARGLAAIARAGCGACHEIPGLDWPRGRLGPSLAGFDDIGLIAGAVPNTAQNLAAFIRNAPAVKPGSTMPPMPVSEDEARAIAAYLYGLNG